MTLRKAVTRILAGTMLAGALALGWQAPALAHDKLVSTSPKDGVALDAAPSEIVLTYNEPVQTDFANVVVAGPGGTNIAQGKPQVVGNQVTQPVKAEAPNGTYTVSWRVVSSDGHPIDGTFTYSIKLVVPTPTKSEASTTEPTTEPSAGPSTPASTSAGTSDQSQAGGGGSAWPWVVGALVLIVIIVGGVLLGRRGRQRNAGAGTGRAG
ncbi:copper resistance CopC family protein [Flindersiella endophytica]